MYVCCRLPSAYRPFPLHVFGCHGFEILVPDACIGCQRFRLSASHAFIRTCGPNRAAFAAEGILFTPKIHSGRLQTNASDLHFGTLRYMCVCLFGISGYLRAPVWSLGSPFITLVITLKDFGVFLTLCG